MAIRAREEVLGCWWVMPTPLNRVPWAGQVSLGGGGEGVNLSSCLGGMVVGRRETHFKRWSCLCSHFFEDQWGQRAGGGSVPGPVCKEEKGYRDEVKTITGNCKLHFYDRSFNRELL